MQVVISLLGLSIKEDSRSSYLNNTPFNLKIGNFINSTDVLLNSFDNVDFVFFGTKESIERHKRVYQDIINPNFSLENDKIL